MNSPSPSWALLASAESWDAYVSPTSVSSSSPFPLEEDPTESTLFRPSPSALWDQVLPLPPKLQPAVDPNTFLEPPLSLPPSVGEERVGDSVLPPPPSEPSTSSPTPILTIPPPQEWTILSAPSDPSLPKLYIRDTTPICMCHVRQSELEDSFSLGVLDVAHTPSVFSDLAIRIDLKSYRLYVIYAMKVLSYGTVGYLSHPTHGLIQFNFQETSQYKNKSPRLQAMLCERVCELLQKDRPNWSVYISKGRWIHVDPSRVDWTGVTHWSIRKRPRVETEDIEPIDQSVPTSLAYIPLTPPKSFQIFIQDSKHLESQMIEAPLNYLITMRQEWKKRMETCPEEASAMEALGQWADIMQNYLFYAKQTTLKYRTKVLLLAHSVASSTRPVIPHVQK